MRLFFQFNLILVALATCNSLQGQTGVSTPVDNLIPPSPESAALGKYAQIPVGHYTGIPQISIPIYEAKEGDISVPISLFYHASGNKVEEIASRVGMGWTLSAGGSIMRTVVGEADESWGGYLIGTAAYTPGEISNGTSQTSKYNIWRGLLGCNDAEPDVFAFNFNGHVGKFGFGWNTGLAYSIRVSSSTKMKVEVLDSLGNPWVAGQYFSKPKIFGFKVTTVDGTVYLFKHYESTYQRILHKIEPPSDVCHWDVASTGYPSPVVTTWNLTKIVSPAGNEVYFNYDDYDLEFCLTTAEVKHRYVGAPTSAGGISKRDTAKIKTLGKYLRSISTKSGNTLVEFNPDLAIRTDLPNRYNGSPNILHSLGSIVIKSRSGDGTYKVTKQYHFGYSNEIGRLTLKTAQELSTDGTGPVKPPHRFSYNTAVTLPSFNGRKSVSSYQQDHWGFLNGNTTNSLIPPYQDPNWGDCGWVNGTWVCDGLFLPGANRQTSPDSTMAGILTQIQYPTGGTTKFEYEPNSYGNIGGAELQSNKIAGGTRIWRITDRDGSNSGNDIVRKFLYEMPSGKSSGVISQEPIYNYEISVTHYPTGGDPTAWLGDYQDGINWNDCDGAPVPEPIDFIARSATSQIPLGMTQGSHIGYQRVIELIGQNGEGGKSEFMFTSFADNNDDYSAASVQPFPPAVVNDFRRGLVSRQIDYKFENNSYIATTQKDYQYSSKSFDLAGFKVGEQFPGSSRYCINQFSTSWHSFRMGQTVPVRTTVTLFKDGKSFVNETSFAYDPDIQFLLQKTSVLNSTEKMVSTYSYPWQYNAPPTSAIYALQQRHILSPVVEEVVVESKWDNPDRVIGAGYTEFKVFPENGNSIYPYKKYSFKSESPATDFMGSVSNSGSFDHRYYQEEASYDNYNAAGVPEQITKPGGVITSYVWGYGGSLPIAEITNAPFSQCAFTNFESSDTGSWTYADVAANYNSDSKTGKRSYKGTLTSAVMPTGKYIVSVWAKGTGSITVNGISQTVSPAWSRYQWTVSNPGTIVVSSNGNLIDDVRLHPKEAIMKTFTYEPGIGISTTTDANHQSVFYEYDGYGRLKNVRDSDGNIVKNHRYVFHE